MAQKIQTLLIDDLDGGQAEGTVRFGLDGAEYEIDLSAKNAEAMRKALEPYVSAARRASGSVARRPDRNGRRAATTAGPDSTAVRECYWYIDQANNFLTLVQFRIIRKQKALYIQLGMPVVRQVINQLRQLTGQSPITDVPYETWPIEEVASTLGLSLPKPTFKEAILPPWLTEPERLEPSLSSFLGQTPPYFPFLVAATTTVPAIPLPSGSLYTFLTGYPVSPGKFSDLSSFCMTCIETD
jgi:hypothetical protein